MLVYVRNKNGNPLMPCKPAKARKLLRDGKAKVVNRCPFTIQLLWDGEENVQPVTVGIDKGSHITGWCCVGNGTVLMSGEIHHRTDINAKISARRANTRNRRSRKWYRQRRFDNRAASKRSGRLPPTIRANVEEVIRVVRQIPLPITHIVVEDVQVDIVRLNNPDLQGVAYQESNRLDENLRIATLRRDDYQCTQCGEKNTRLEAHHIIPRSLGGKDTITNLITLCKRCHDKHHQGKLKLNVSGVSGFFDQIAQRTMQGKAYLYETLGQMATLSKVFGYQTSAYRKSLDLPKSHDIDALCVATLVTGEIINPDCQNFYSIKFRPRQTRRQYHDLPRKGGGRVKYQVNASFCGFRKGDVIRVKGKWIKQINSIYSNGYLPSFCTSFWRAKCCKTKRLSTITTRANCNLGQRSAGWIIFNV
ncbi:HNH endonuclease [Candidatus Poribacteria bacterium]|nr:HNH endonuclease [Candidatus Poribacteria bacterium]